MSTTKTFAESEILTGLTPGGLGRLIAVLGGSAAENPYPAGTPQHLAWRKSFEDALSLQRDDLLALPPPSGYHLNS